MGNKYYQPHFKGFTLVEALVYIAILSIVILSISVFFIWAIRSDAKSQVMAEVVYNAERAMAVMIHEIKESQAIYTPTSLFDAHPGQLSLVTNKYLPQGEADSYLDFYLCGSQLCFKKESQQPVFITSNNVAITNLVFSEIVSGQTPSVQINLTVDYINPQAKPEYEASISLQSTVSLVLY